MYTYKNNRNLCYAFLNESIVSQQLLMHTSIEFETRKQQKYFINFRTTKIPQNNLMTILKFR